LVGDYSVNLLALSGSTFEGDERATDEWKERESSDLPDGAPLELKAVLFMFRSITLTKLISKK